MAKLLYVDNSNFWIERMHVAAAKHGHAPDVWTAVQQRICDYMSGAATNITDIGGFGRYR
jgi:hypothetical protein